MPLTPSAATVIRILVPGRNTRRLNNGLRLRVRWVRLIRTLTIRRAPAGTECSRSRFTRRREMRARSVVAKFFAGRDGALVRALHEASAYDEEARRVWREFNEPVIAAFTERVNREVQAGRVPPVDVERMVRALVGMNLYAFFNQIVGNPDADPEAIAETLLTVWTRAFLLSDPEAEGR